MRSYDEKDMPRIFKIADAYEELQEMYFSGDYQDVGTALEVVAGKYELTAEEQNKILSWVEDDILDATEFNNEDI